MLLVGAAADDVDCDGIIPFVVVTLRVFRIELEVNIDKKKGQCPEKNALQEKL